jgi:hypothetical protein
MAPVRHIKSFVAVLSVLALGVKVLAGPFCHVPAAARAIVDPVLGVLSICEPGAHETPAPRGPDPAGDTDHCKACTLLSGLALAMALAVLAIVFPPARVQALLPVGGRTIADHLSLGGIRSRAPPLPA